MQSALYSTRTGLSRRERTAHLDWGSRGGHGARAIPDADGSGPGKAQGQRAELLRDARTNGELFLALPANQAARNSINDSGSLFNVLCGGSSEPCQGSTAGQAGFRTESGTQARLGGLFLIAIGALGMILLIGFIALPLLGAAIMSLLYLLMAPAAVLAPALGDGGRIIRSEE